jgi:hypothetical protein
MAKAKVTVTITKEVEFNPEYYPENYTPEQMLAEEIYFADDMFHEWVDSNKVSFETKGELIG